MPRLNGLYAIADAGVLEQRGILLRVFAEELRATQVGTLQWRCKAGSPRDILQGAAVLREVFAGTGTLLILNDRVDLALLAGFDGVHLGQADLSPEAARLAVAKAVARPAHFVIGVSTHTPAEIAVADAGEADYLAVGPVFATGSKADAAPVVGLEGVRQARALTGKSLVAIGGITRANAPSIRDAGADAVAIISGLLEPGTRLDKVVGDIQKIFR